MSIDISHEITQFLDCCRGKGMTNNTIVAYRSNLKSFVSYIRDCDNPWEVNDESVAGYIEHINEYCSQNTVDKRISTLRLFLDYLVLHGKIAENYVRNVRSPIAKFYVSVPIDILKVAREKKIDCNELLLESLKRELEKE